MSDEYVFNNEQVKALGTEALERFKKGGYTGTPQAVYAVPPEVRPRGRSATIEKTSVLGYWIFPDEYGLGEPWWRLTRTGATKRARKYIDAGSKRREAWVVR